MRLTERQRLIRDVLEEALGSGDTIDALAVRIDQRVPSLPAPERGHLPPVFVQTTYPQAMNGQIAFDLDTFYEEVVMPSRERYMARHENRRSGDRD